MSQQNLKTIQDLKLEVQELRQFCIMLVLQLRNSGISERQADMYWEKFTQYLPVKVDENAMDCCQGGPQWGHDWGCPTLP